MNTGTVRFILLSMPTILVVTWGFLSRATTLPFALAAAVIFAVVLAVGTAARQSVRPGTLAAAASIGGVLSAVLGLPFAVLAMLPRSEKIGGVSIGYDGWEGVPPALVWSVLALTLATAGALLCTAAVLLGRQVGLRISRRTPNSV